MPGPGYVQSAAEPRAAAVLAQVACRLRTLSTPRSTTTMTSSTGVPCSRRPGAFCWRPVVACAATAARAPLSARLPRFLGCFAATSSSQSTCPKTLPRAGCSPSRSGAAWACSRAAAGCTTPSTGASGWTRTVLDAAHRAAVPRLGHHALAHTRALDPLGGGGAHLALVGPLARLSLLAWASYAVRSQARAAHPAVPAAPGHGPDHWARPRQAHRSRHRQGAGRRYRQPQPSLARPPTDTDGRARACPAACPAVSLERPRVIFRAAVLDGLRFDCCCCVCARRPTQVVG